MSVAESNLKNIPITGPFDTLRDYIAALEARGRLIRIDKMDQDQYEATGFAYRLIDELGHDKAPTFLIEKIKIDGEWREGPVIGNLYGGWDIEAMIFGVEDITDNQERMYQAVIDKLFSHLGESGEWKRIKPTSVESNSAPCKEVILTGEDIDIFDFPWLKVHPTDAGRYINTGSVFVQDPKLGRNVGTYRCQVKGKTKIGVNARPTQHGGVILTSMKSRGEEIAKVAIALGVDPIIWSLSGSKLSGFGEDELEIAGGLKGKPIEVVKCETCDIMVPAHAEMIIEGEIPLQESEDEGPYGEMYGYLGAIKLNNFFMNIKAITHRRDPIFFNSYTGIAPDMIMGPVMAAHYWKYKKLIPNLVGVYQFKEASGVLVVSIDKKFAGEGLQAGQYVVAGPTCKVAIVVDKDINIQNPLDVLHAIAARWQPMASLLMPQARLTMPDPSVPLRGLSGKMIIDATHQFADEGGPKSWPPLNRDLLIESCPDLMDLVDEKWSKYWQAS